MPPTSASRTLHWADPKEYIKKIELPPFLPFCQAHFFPGEVSLCCNVKQSKNLKHEEWNVGPRYSLDRAYHRHASLFYHYGIEGSPWENRAGKRLSPENFNAGQFLFFDDLDHVAHGPFLQWVLSTQFGINSTPTGPCLNDSSANRLNYCFSSKKEPTYWSQCQHNG